MIKRHSVFSWLCDHQISLWFWGIFIVAFAFFSVLKHEPIFLDGDPFYHAKISQLMLDQRDIVRDFPYLPKSVFHSGYTDHHFLFHIFLMPFVATIGDPLIAIRMATSLLAALFLAGFWLFFRALLPQLAFFPLITILVSSTLMFRLSLDKAPAISLIVLLCGLYALIRRKPFWLFCISFLYVWLYDAWPLLLIAACLFCIADACVELLSSDKALSFRTCFSRRFFSLCVRKKNGILFSSCFFGLLAGIIINPYFPSNILFYKTHLISIALVTGGVFWGIGNEWLPIHPFAFAHENLFFLIFWISALCWTMLQISFRAQTETLPSHDRPYAQSSLSVPSLFFCLFSLVLFLATIKSQRMGEYFIPIGAAYIAFTFHDFFCRAQWRDWLVRMRTPFLHPSHIRQSIFCGIVGVFFVALFLSSSVSAYRTLWRDVNANHFSFFSLARAATFLQRTVPKGSLVINDNWSHFPQLLYYADEYQYAWGLDPTFTHDAYPDFFKTVSDLGKEKWPSGISQALKHSLGTSYLLITKLPGQTQEKNLILLAKKDPGLKKIYEDDEALIYQVRQ